MNEAQAFSAAELASEHMEAEIAKWTKVFTWMEDEPQNTCVARAAAAASNPVTRGDRGHSQ
jgi:hypothetical protein